VLVATDIASRGIDVSKISHVINYDMPDTAEAYTHRIGRTGRMENQGTAFSLVTQEDLPMVRTIERLLDSALERRQMDGFEVRFSTSEKPKTPRPHQRRLIPNRSQRMATSSPDKECTETHQSSAPWQGIFRFTVRVLSTRPMDIVKPNK